MASYFLLKIIRKLPGRVIKLIPKPRPALTEGFGSRNKVGVLCSAAGYQSVLLVTDQTLFSLGYHTAVVDSLTEQKIRCTVFHEIASEPNIGVIEKGRAAALDCGASCIVALGGGSVLDSSKMIAAGTKLKKRRIPSLLKKFLFVRGGTLPMISIPSTAGTGAEFTVGAVVTGSKGKKGSTVLIRLKVTDVILDSELTIKAPRGVTAACAIDALSHGLEGAVAAVKVSDEDVRKSYDCVRLVLENLPKVLESPQDTEARQNMCRAAYCGGNAINEQLAGYVHAFAHSIGALYHIPHGAAIAAALLPVMEFQKAKCIRPLAALARYCGYASESDGDEAAADSILSAIAGLIALCGFAPADYIKDEDYPTLIKRISGDAINYSPPIVLKKRDIIAVLDRIRSRQE